MEKKKNKKLGLELKTDLPDLRINSEIRNYKFNSGDIITMKDAYNKKKLFSFYPSSLLFQKMNKTELTFNSIDFSKFDKIIFDSNSSLNSNYENKPMSQLLDDDFYFYIKKIKQLYRLYKKNHKINNNSFFNKSFFIVKDEYEESINLKNILVDNKEFLDEIDNYKTHDKYLEKNKNELYDIIKLFDKKVGMIENELLYCLFYSEFIINFILRNYFIEYNIKRISEIFEKRKKRKNEIKKRFIYNNTKIFLIQNKRKNIKKLKEVSKIILTFYEKVRNIKYSSLTVEKERNSILNLQKELVPIKQKLKGKIKLINYIENEMINVTGISESKYINSFIIYIDEIMKLCFSNFTIKESLEKVILNNNFDLTTSIKNNIPNFKYINSNNEEIIFYHLSNLPFNSKEKILSLLEIYSFIITQNFDISQIQEKLKNIFLVIIEEICDKIIEKGIEKLKIEGQAFIFLKENFDFLIELFVNNFGMSPKIFKEIIKYILNEAKNKSITLLMKIMEETISLLPSHFYETKIKIINIMGNFFNLIEFNYNEFFNQYENDFIFKFFTSQNDLLENLMEKEEWLQINNFDIKYQFIMNIISIDYNNITEKDLNIVSKDNKKINYIECKNEKFKLISSTLFILDFIYQVYYILFYVKNNSETQTIILQLVKMINNYILKCNLSIIEGIGKIGKEKRLITEKEYILLNSNLCLIQSILFNINSFIIGDNDDEIINLINKHIKKINLIHLKCIEIINAILDVLKIDIISKFEKLDFLKYPILENQKYNDYVIRFIKFEEIYNNMINAFNNDDIINIFKNIFDNFFNEFEIKYSNKKGFGDENMLNQFKKDLLYIKEIIQKFDLINNNSYFEKIDNLIKNLRIEEKRENELIENDDNKEEKKEEEKEKNEKKNENKINEKEEEKRRKKEEKEKKEEEKRKKKEEKEKEKQRKKEEEKKKKEEEKRKKEENEEKNPKEKKMNKLFNKFTGFIKNKKKEKDENNITEKLDSTEAQTVKKETENEKNENKNNNEKELNDNLINLNDRKEENNINDNLNFESNKIIDNINENSNEMKLDLDE